LCLCPPHHLSAQGDAGFVLQDNLGLRLELRVGDGRQGRFLPPRDRPPGKDRDARSLRTHVIQGPLAILGHRGRLGYRWVARSSNDPSDVQEIKGLGGGLL
jgi:hypothetical protein